MLVLRLKDMLRLMSRSAGDFSAKPAGKLVIQFCTFRQDERAQRLPLSQEFVGRERACSSLKLNIRNYKSEYEDEIGGVILSHVPLGTTNSRSTGNMNARESFVHTNFHRQPKATGILGRNFHIDVYGNGNFLGLETIDCGVSIST